MELPTVQENLRTIGAALQSTFEEKGAGKFGPSEIEAFVKDFQIPTGALKPADREMTYRLVLFGAKDKRWGQIGISAALPWGGETGCPNFIITEGGVYKVQSGSSFEFVRGDSDWYGNSTDIETIFSKSVKVPAAQPAPEK
jgi:hypothetical protein